MVAADAGCGKTTLIADFVRNQNRPSVWYQLDHTDADPVVFLGYVAHGIKNLYPEFGEAIFPYLSEANEEVLRFPERAADLLINEILQSVEQPFILVLDDYHHIGRDTVVHKMVDRLLQYSSDLVHLIITTRDLPPLAIMRRRTQSAALVITRDDLLFTDDEVRELFRKTLERRTEGRRDRRVSRAHARLDHGSAACPAGRRAGDARRKRTAAARSARHSAAVGKRHLRLFRRRGFFARGRVRRSSLLMHLSLLESLQLDLCSALFPDLRCSAALPELAQKNVFLTVAGDGQIERGISFPSAVSRFSAASPAIRGRTGDASPRNGTGSPSTFSQRSKWEMALPVSARRAKFRSRRGRHRRNRRTTGSPPVRSLRSAFSPNRFRTRSLEQYPAFAAAQGRDRTAAGRDRKVVDASAPRRRSFSAKRTIRPAKPKLCIRSRVSRAAAADPHEAFELLERAEALVPQTSETFMKCANTRGLCLIVQGKWTEAEQQFRVALDLAEKLANEHYIRLVTHNLALAPGFRGDFGEALRWFKRIFREGQPDKQLPQEAIGHLNVARLHLYRGEFEETEKHLEPLARALPAL